MEYIKTKMEQAVAVDSIISVHYYEYPIDFAFSGEIHDFWELVYADKGDAVITAGNHELLLPRGHMYLHQPMEYHNIRCNDTGTVNSFIISFASDCQALYSLAGRPVECGSRVRGLMADIVTETRNAFAGPLDQVYMPRLERREEALFGSEQLVQLYLEQLLVLLVRSQQQSADGAIATPTTNQRRGDALLQSVCRYLEEHVTENLNMDQLCREFSVSKSTLQKLFQNRIGHGVSRYYQQLKVDQAKVMIREKQYNFTEIAQHLGYSSVHYFSRHFKQIAGMTPSEYASSMKAMMQEQL